MKTIRKSHNTIIKCSYFNQQGFLVKFNSFVFIWKMAVEIDFSLPPPNTSLVLFRLRVHRRMQPPKKSHKSAIRCLSNYGLAIIELIKRGELARVWNSETNTVRATHDKSCVRFAGRDCIPDAMQRRKFYATQSLASGNFSMLKLCSLATMLLSKGSTPCKFQIILCLMHVFSFAPLSPILCVNEPMIEFKFCL